MQRNDISFHTGVVIKYKRHGKFNKVPSYSSPKIDAKCYPPLHYRKNI